jgi:hypothetical protein
MLPRFAMNNTIYRYPANTKFPTKGWTVHRTFLIGVSYFEHIARSKYRILMFFPHFYQFRMHSLPVAISRGNESVNSGVSHIFGVGDVLKVFRSIVQLVTVFVVDLLSCWTRANERSSHQFVNKMTLALKSNLKGMKRDYSVSIALVRRKEPIVGAMIMVQAISSYASKIRHAIDSLVSNNVAPFFVFEFLSGKFLISHCENLQDRFEFWSGSLENSNSLAGRLYFNTGEAAGRQPLAPPAPTIPTIKGD